MAQDKFSNRLEYFLTALSFAVGLGNVWRFPYLCYRNGGGSFLVTYVFCAIFLGVTYFFFESSLGQFTQRGPIELWAISPVFQGIGYAMFVMNAFIAIYYNVIVAWAIYYLYASFSAMPEVPWAHCDNAWNTERCLEYDNSNWTSMSISSNHSNQPSSLTTLSPSQEYFYNQVLEMSTGINELGSVRWPLVVCLALSWILIFAGLCLGTKSMGKVSYFTALFPYAMITALLVNGMRLDGAIDGILHYVKPDFSRITSIDTWSDAATQIFFSLAICYGGVITLASYNPYNTNTIKNTLVITACNSLTSVYSGFAIFSVIGFMAHSVGKPIEEAADQGVGLAFVAYPAALSRLSLPWLWSAIFFFMLIVLGFGSQMTIVETLVVNTIEMLPKRWRPRKVLVLAAVCVTMFLTGITMCTGAGIYILQLMDTYSVPYAAFVIGFFEMIAIAWVYGIDRYLRNIRSMIGFDIWPRYWHLMLRYACPAAMAFIFVLVVAQHKPLTYNHYTFPVYANAIGWLGLTGTSVLMIPAFAAYQLWRVHRGVATFKDILKPDVILHDQMYRTNTYAVESRDNGLSLHVKSDEQNGTKTKACVTRTAQEYASNEKQTIKL